MLIVRGVSYQSVDQQWLSFMTVLDNGVVSNEYWRILDCADDMSWAGKGPLLQRILLLIAFLIADGR